MKEFSYTIMLLTAMFILTGCAQEADPQLPEPEPALKMPISWNIESVQSPANSRTLMNNTLLQEACTPTTGGESIGIWGQYTIDQNGITATVEEFNATPLTYAAKAQDSNPRSNWNYPGIARYWEYGGVYDFRACFPQDEMTKLMTQISATVLQGGPINTSVLQEDILVAATQVNTTTADLKKPVQLSMEHVFAAVMFKVKAAYGYVPSSNEGVTSCWLQNQSKETNLFSPSGYLLHIGNSNPEIIWYPYESSDAPMYLWKHQEGVNFNTENTLYTNNGGREGEIYTKNDGWLLVVPQEVKAETLRFYYTLKQTGDKIFSVKIPAITYESGKKYTYMLEIRGSDMELSLDIAPWNNLDSNHDITI